MIVFDLVCGAHSHIFEGWFACGAAFSEQKERGLLTCPVCNDSDVRKAVMAPNVGAKGNQARAIAERPQSEKPPAVQDAPSAGAVAVQNVPEMNARLREMIGAVAKAQAQMLENSRWVGKEFADRARDIHYGDADSELIHGETSEKEAQDLLDEGISIAPLPLPVIPPESNN